jgi:hypothetical protein
MGKIKYTIWGIPWKGEKEELLCDKTCWGEDITTLTKAKSLKLYYETNKGSSKVRIKEEKNQ